ncbi:MAG: hypothetical protein DMF60_19730 [Acidobacteria bacterium]|nr:MAG: hypothetical protein DMF60_19730 [Acidobacteriota bacterium]
MLGSHDSALKRQIQTLADKHSFIRKFVRPPSNSAFAQQVGAVSAFSVLGPRAMPAVADILLLLNDPDAAMAAMLAIMYIRPERETDILSLTNVLRIQKRPLGRNPESLHQAAILILSTFGSKAAGAVPILLDQLASTNGNVRATAAIALARIGAPAEKVVPLIVQNLAKTNRAPMIVQGPVQRLLPRPDPWEYLELKMNVWALGQYGHPAREALPALSNLLNGSEMGLRRESRSAIEKITAGTNHVSQ